MKLYRPVKTNQLNQGFGENRSCAKLNANGAVIRPFQIIIKTGLTCPIKSAGFYTALGMKGHNGYDHAAWHGEPVYHCADFDGWMKTEHDQDGGLGVDIISNEPVLNGKYVKIRYWHGKSVIGWEKKPVKTGELIMLADSTGASSGDHLHWAPKWCDKEGRGIENNNGYAGAFNPTPYYENTFVLDWLNVRRQAISAIELAKSVILQIKLTIQSWKR